ncbi:hypothetical protein [Mucilaginibacter sp.]|uniref:hypothetical protein n=1 Tax=Mucilaginibacter sp. TaxID=1882438 RepID=UPI003D11E6CA
MNLFKSKQQNHAVLKVNERLAAIIATKLIGFQYRLSIILGKWFNACSVRQKKWMVLTVGLCITAILLSGLCNSLYMIPLQPVQNYSAAHIGMPSVIPHQKINNNQITDSLTIKIRSWKQQ